jgi:hypothetical protein
MHQDKTNVVERLKNMEDKLGVTLKGLFWKITGTPYLIPGFEKTK